MAGATGSRSALTSGNADTSNFNITFELQWDAGTKHDLSWDGLYIRGANEGVTNVNRTTVRFRDEYQRSARTFFFGQVDYLRDTFKQIDQLVAPTAGAGYRLYATDVATWSVDAGVGAAWEEEYGEGRTIERGRHIRRELRDRTRQRRHAHTIRDGALEDE